MKIVMVEAQNLSVQFGDFWAVSNVSFQVEKGEIFGFLGANGAGKTTTIRVLCGLLPPSRGQVQIAGTDYGAGERAIKAKVGYMSQKFTLYNDLTVGENLEFTASLRKLEKNFYLERRNRLLEFIAFAKPLNTMVRDLAGGLKQQVSLVASLLHDPEIVFLDEPTAGVTPASRAKFWSLIRKLQSQGKTMFVTTHYMDEAEYCDRIALMRAGELIALDTVDGLKTSAFPAPIFELEPKASITRVDLEDLRQDPALKSFAPYGIRFHAVTRSEEAWEKSLPRFLALFDVRRVKPSLEDVFIELVEGRNQDEKRD